MSVLREYAGPLVLALLVHAGIAAVLVRGWQPDGDDMPRLMQPRIIEASILVMEKPAPRPPLPSARPDPVAPPTEPEPEPVKTEPKPEPPPKPDPEVERRAQEEAERQGRLRELAEQSTAQAFESEAADLEEATADAQTMTYMDAINRAIVAQWSRPPSARNDMKARFRVELVPSGELLGVMLLETSGSAAFDRSAEIAIRKASPFEMPPDNDVFEAHFRRFTLLFNPQDLLR